jgi:hypothetical protein
LVTVTAVQLLAIRARKALVITDEELVVASSQKPRHGGPLDRLITTGTITVDGATITLAMCGDRLKQKIGLSEMEHSTITPTQQ